MLTFSFIKVVDFIGFLSLDCPSKFVMIPKNDCHAKIGFSLPKSGIREIRIILIFPEFDILL